MKELYFFHKHIVIPFQLDVLIKSMILIKH